MRTNIELDDELVKEAFRFSEGISTKKGLIEQALKDFIEHRKMKDLRELKGKITFEANYDYKELRVGS